MKSEFQNCFNRIRSAKALAIAFINMPHRIILVLALTLSAAQSLNAQDDISLSNTGGSALPTAANTFTMNMRQADIRAFIQWVADRVEKNIIIHRSVNGTVTVISSKAVTPDEAYELFLTVLKMNGFAAVESDGTVQVIPDAEAKTADIPFLGDEANRGDIVTAVIELQYVDAGNFLQVLRPLAPATAHMAPYLPTNSIIVADTARSITRTQKIISLLDQEEGEFDYEIVPIIHASAEDIEGIIRAVTQPSGGNGGDAQAQSQAFEIAVDNRSNSLLLTGNIKRRLQIRRLISKLDTPLDGDGNTSVIYLNYIEASEIATILEGVGNSLLRDTKTEDLKEFSIQSSETNNALVISAPQAVMNSIKSVIKRLDIPRAQVLVEAVVVSVSGDFNNELGFAGVGSEVFEDALDGNVFGANLDSAGASASDAFAGLAAANAAGTDPGTAIAGALAGSSGFTYGYLEDGNLGAVLRAVASRSKSNIMSTPTIVALDNEEASLLVGQNIPFITGSATSSGANVNNPFQTIERQDVGITLNITPRINQGDSITLDIDQTTENVSQTTVAGASDLVTDKTEINTSVLIKDGQILVLGGLMSDSDSESRTQIPILGDIPVLGRLFRSKSKTKNKNNLVVFIKPTILKDQLQINGITAERYAFMREQQLQNALETFIRHSDKPLLEEYETIKPQPIQELAPAG